MTPILFRKLAPLVAMALALAAIGWAVSFGTLPPADFTFSNDTEIKTVDPAIVTGQPEGRIIRCIFEGLINWDPETLQPIPGVSELPEISNDGRTYTFRLRHNARWSDDSPVTAHDFVWSNRRMLHPETAAEYSYELWYIVGARDFTTAKVAPGKAVEIELHEQPEGSLPYASGTILRGRLLRIESPDGRVLADAKPQPDVTDPDTPADSVETTDVAVPPSDAAHAEVAQDKSADADKVYIVEIDGREERFSQSGAEGTRDYKWLLPDFEEVGIHALDDHTLRIDLIDPTPYFTQLMGFYPLFPVNRRCVETHGYPMWTKPENIVTNGPYLLAERRIRDRVRMVKNPLYWDRDNVHFNVVDALSLQSTVTALNLYMTGEVDYIPQTPATVVPELLAQQRPDFTPAPYLGTYYFRLNVDRPPLDNKLVRQALNLATDKREIVEKVTRAGQIPARSFVPAAIQDYMPYEPGECGEYDVERARQLLAEAGYPGGKGCPRIYILYNTHETHKAIAEVLQSQWKKNLGIDVALENQEWSVYQSQTRQMEYWVSRAAWIGDYVDPITFLNMFVTDGANNQTGWGNARYDELIEATQHESDQTKRLAQFHEAEQILMDEMPIIPIYFYVSLDMVRPYVKGFYANIQDVHPIQGMSIDRAEKERILAEEALP